jgi:hypothetical protein
MYFCWPNNKVWKECSSFRPTVDGSLIYWLLATQSACRTLMSEWLLSESQSICVHCDRISASVHCVVLAQCCVFFCLSNLCYHKKVWRTETLSLVHTCTYVGLYLLFYWYCIFKCLCHSFAPTIISTNVMHKLP